MDMFDEIGSIGEEDGNYNMPVGEHPALLTDVKINNERKWVNFNINFLGTSVVGKGMFFLSGKDGDPDKTKRAQKRVALQVKNATGKFPKDGPSLRAGILSLEGRHVKVDVKNRDGSQYQDYFITEPYTVERGAEVSNLKDDDKLPF